LIREVSEGLIRVSIGSLALLDLVSLNMKYKPTTLYMLQYSPYGCLARCSFCSQSFSSRVSKKYLSRITWYSVKLSSIVEKLIDKKKLFKRICFQTILKKYFIQETVGIMEYLREQNIELPVSIATTPVSKYYLEKLYDLGVDYLGVGLDTATPILFIKHGKPYTWSVYMEFIENALEIFGEKHVYVHLIVGLGEDSLELYSLMEKLINIGCNIALFPYTSIDKRSPLVDLRYYRSTQIIRYFLQKNYKLEEIVEDGIVKRELIEEIISNLDKYYEIFITTGCPHCNRPYYTENPKGPFYNIYGNDHFEEYKRRLIEELKQLSKFNR